jgi:hypothetical protein
MKKFIRSREKPPFEERACTNWHFSRRGGGLCAVALSISHFMYDRA